MLEGVAGADTTATGGVAEWGTEGAAPGATPAGPAGGTVFAAGPVEGVVDSEGPVGATGAAGIVGEVGVEEGTVFGSAGVV